MYPYVLQEAESIWPIPLMIVLAGTFAISVAVATLALFVVGSPPVKSGGLAAPLGTDQLAIVTLLGQNPPPVDCDATVKLAVAVIPVLEPLINNGPVVLI